MSKLKLFAGLSLCLLLFSNNAVTETSHPISVLIVDGYGNHDWENTTHYIQRILDAAEIFETTVSTVPLDTQVNTEIDAEMNWHPDFSDFDVVIQTVNDLGGRGPVWPKKVEKNFEDYVAQGGGLYIFHSANNAFSEWPEYNRMIGLGWRDESFGKAISVNEDERLSEIPAGIGLRTSHGKRSDEIVTRIGEHPIHTNIPRQWRAANLEVYRYARGPAEHLTVLSYAEDQETGLNFPIEWVINYHQGRVYNSTFGHLWHDQAEPVGLACAGFQTIFVRALQWLANSNVDTGLPKDFPGTSAVSLREF